MKAYMHSKGKWVLIGCLLSILVLTLHPADSAHGGFKDKLRELGNKAKNLKQKTQRKWKERERRCSSCGKTIHMGSTCARCMARKAADGAGRLKRSAGKKIADAKTTWDKRAHPCSVCGKTIHTGKRCASCATKAVVKRGKEFAADGKQKWQEKVKPKLKKARERASEWCVKQKAAASRMYQKARDIYAPRFKEAIQNPENREKALIIIGKAMSIRAQIKASTHDATYNTLKTGFSLPIRNENGVTTIGEIAREYLVGKHPGLAGTDIAEDPAAVVAALACDKSALLTEIKWFKDGNRSLSVTEALAGSSPFGISGIKKGLALTRASESVSHAAATGEGGLDAMLDTVSAIRAMNE